MSIPRKCYVEKQTAAERAIRTAMAEVESMGADKLLTDAVTLLSQAFDKCAEYTDSQYERAAQLQLAVDDNTAK